MELNIVGCCLPAGVREVNLSAILICSSGCEDVNIRMEMESELEIRGSGSRRRGLGSLPPTVRAVDVAL